MYILDTDHISLFQRRDTAVLARVLTTPAVELATTVITVEEQLRGRLAQVRRARSDAEVVRSYHSLLATIVYFQTITVIAFDESAQAIFNCLRAQRPRVGTQDLRIAAIALSQEATLVTRNQHDFAGIPSLSIEDWSSTETDGNGH
jgi:tRNA(fMet)-specific endonuclease VapC